MGSNRMEWGIVSVVTFIIMVVLLHLFAADFFIPVTSVVFFIFLLFIFDKVSLASAQMRAILTFFKIPLPPGDKAKPPPQREFDSINERLTRLEKSFGSSVGDNVEGAETKNKAKDDARDRAIPGEHRS